MKVTYWPIENIKPYTRNARKIPPKAVEKVADSIQHFGWRQPVVVDGEGVIICGHTRWLAAQKLGLKRVPVHQADNLTPAEVKAYRLMDNRSHQETDWDFDLLSEELLEIRGLDLDLSLTGFDGNELDTLLIGQEDDDRANLVPELIENPVTAPGDLWRCGPHRLLCGDATEADAVARLLGTTEPVLMVTDPPYGVGYEPEWRERAGLGRQRQRGRVRNDHQADWSTAYRLFPGEVAYVWHAGLHVLEVARGLVESGFEIRSQIIWVKQHFALSRGHYHWAHENCAYCVRNGGSAHWQGDRRQTTVWQVANLNPFGGNRSETATGHGTQKPVDLMRRPVLNHTQHGEPIYDPFLGSGTTLIAAEQNQRICFGMDIDPRYVDVAVRRWEQFTGRQAQLAETAETLEQVRVSRQR